MEVINRTYTNFNNILSIVGKENSGRHSLLKQFQINFGNIANDNHFSIISGDGTEEITNYYKILPIATKYDLERFDNIQFYTDILIFLIDINDLVEIFGNNKDISSNDKVHQLFTLLNKEILDLIQIIILSGCRNISVCLNKIDSFVKTDNIISFNNLVKDFMISFSKLFKSLCLNYILEEVINISFNVISLKEELGIKKPSETRLNDKETSYICQDYISLEEFLVKASFNNSLLKKSNTNFNDTDKNSSNNNNFAFLLINDKYTENKYTEGDSLYNNLVISGKLISGEIKSKDILNTNESSVNKLLTLLSYNPKDKDDADTPTKTIDENTLLLKFEYVSNFYPSLNKNNNSNYSHLLDRIIKREFITIKSEYLNQSPNIAENTYSIIKDNLLVLKNEIKDIKKSNILFQSKALVIEMKVIILDKNEASLISPGITLYLSFNRLIHKAKLEKISETYNLDDDNNIILNLNNKSKFIKESCFCKAVISLDETLNWRSKFSDNKQLSLFHSVDINKKIFYYGRILKYKPL